MPLRADIIRQAKLYGLDPYTTPFKPSDLDLRASDYGSFSDHCSKEETASGQYAPDVILKVVERDKGNKPRKYLLIR